MAQKLTAKQEAFANQIEPEPNTGCELWTGVVNERGYGVFPVGSKTNKTNRHVLAHRFAWELKNGEIPAGLCVLHRCDQPGCTNVEHLFLGDRNDNLKDMARKGRGRVSKTGLPFGVERISANSFRAGVTVNGKRIRLGQYPTPELASAAAIAKKNELLGLRAA